MAGHYEENVGEFRPHYKWKWVEDPEPEEPEVTILPVDPPKKRGKK